MNRSDITDGCWGGCNCCGRFCYCHTHDCWPARDGVYYGRLCASCSRRINDPEAWEAERLELIARHSE